MKSLSNSHCWSDVTIFTATQKYQLPSRDGVQPSPVLEGRSLLLVKRKRDSYLLLSRFFSASDFRGGLVGFLAEEEEARRRRTCSVWSPPITSCVTALFQMSLQNRTKPTLSLVALMRRLRTKLREWLQAAAPQEDNLTWTCTAMRRYV